MENEKQVLENKLRQVTAERDEYKALYVSISKSHWKAVEWAENLQRLLEKYQAWFSYHRNWTDHHNRMIQWNPKLGYPDIKGGQPPLSPVATSEVEE